MASIATPTEPRASAVHGTDPSLIAKYSTQGPRYTSYPTALEFSEQFTVADYEQHLNTARNDAAPLSLYVHVPFCRWLCYYCGCNKVVTKKSGAGREYLDHIAIEIALLSERIGNTRQVSQLHFGGGTPTYLDDAELTELIHLLASHFNLGDGKEREYSIEIDPRTVTPDRLALLRGLGFNRLSFGIQDTYPDVQQLREANFDICPEAGFALASFTNNPLSPLAHKSNTCI